MFLKMGLFENTKFIRPVEKFGRFLKLGAPSKCLICCPLNVLLAFGFYCSFSNV